MVLVAWLSSVGVMLAQDAAVVAEVRSRFAQPQLMTPDEVGRGVAAIRAAMGGRSVVVTDGVSSSPVDERGRDMLFVILSGQVAVADIGLKATPSGTLRGLRSPATPPRSEVAASQILWIDPATLLPTRFEFLYDVPGMGDVAYDLVFK